MTAGTSEGGLEALCLVADLGGTNARFALARLRKDGRSVAVEQPWLYPCKVKARDFSSLGEAARSVLAQLPPELKPDRAVFAVASAVQGDVICFTNNDWSFSISALRDELHLSELTVLNDFEAAAWAVPHLDGDMLDPVGGAGFAPLRDGDVRLLLGPGTGLGLAAVGIYRGDVLVTPTEGGHIGFCPADDEDMAILADVRRQRGRVVAENLISGAGLLLIYETLCRLAGNPARYAKAEEVSIAALQGDLAARSAVERICRMLGAYAGDAVLGHGAWSGGVMLTGGVLEHILTPATRPFFLEAFTGKGRYAALLERTPVAWVRHPDLGNYGAALYGAHHLGHPQ